MMVVNVSENFSQEKQGVRGCIGPAHLLHPCYACEKFLDTGMPIFHLLKCIRADWPLIMQVDCK